MAKVAKSPVLTADVSTEPEEKKDVVQEAGPRGEKMVTFVSVYPYGEVIVDRPWDEQEKTADGHLITQRHDGKVMRFNESKCQVEERFVPKIRKFGSYGVTIIEESVLRERAESSDPEKQAWAMGFVREMERRREQKSLPPVTKKVITF